ncbi:MAG: lectin [Xanthobacteraceae bacterium]
MNLRRVSLCAAAAVTFFAAGTVTAQQNDMTFFVTSIGLGKGGDLGGLAGADAYCQSFAQAAGVGSKTWHAYLSTQGAGGVNAKDRIGNGPWKNAKGVVIASNLEELHSPNYKINKTTALTEKGNFVNGRGDTPNQHDMLTGTQQDGTAVAGPDDATCSNWTSSADGQGGAVVGHTDLIGNTQGVNFWNYSHKTPGCAPANLQRVGGAGLFYCFATN